MKIDGHYLCIVLSALRTVKGQFQTGELTFLEEIKVTVHCQTCCAFMSVLYALQHFVDHILILSSFIFTYNMLALITYIERLFSN